jgi:hypothetical protein
MGSRFLLMCKFTNQRLSTSSLRCCAWRVLTTKRFRVEHIRRLNRFAAPLRAVDFPRASTPVRNGFWIRTSYINHDCLPNSVRTFIGDMMFLRATQDINTGDEITAPYVSPELVLEGRQRTYKTMCDF